MKVGTGTLTLTGSGSRIYSIHVVQGNVVLSGGSFTGYLGTTSTTNNSVVTLQDGALVDSRGLDINGFMGNSTLRVTGPGTIWRAGNARFAFANGTSGHAVIEDGATVTDATEFIVGQGGPSTLLLQSGATITTADGVIGQNALAVAVATVTGSGSTWTNGRLSLGGFLGFTGGTGTLNINDGGAVVSTGPTVFWNAPSAIKINGGTLTTGSLVSVGHASGSISGSIDLVDPPAGAALTINGDSSTWTYSGAITGSGSLVKSGASTQILTGSLTYTGPTTVNGGVLEIAQADLGGRSFRSNAGATITYKAPSITGGFLRGGGTHDLSAVTRLQGTTVAADASIIQSKPLTLLNVTAGGAITNEAPLALDGFLLTSAGRLTVSNAVLAQAMESNGLITIAGKGFLSSNGPLVLGGGSRTFIGNVETNDSGGRLTVSDGTLELNGALLVNNGRIKGTTNVNFGSLLTGTGEFGEVFLHPGGTFTPGVAFGIKPNTASDLATIVTAGGDQTVNAPITLLADTVAAVPSDTLRITTPVAATGVTITKTDAGTLELTHVRAAALAVEGGRVLVTPDGTAAGASELDALTISNGGTLDLTDNDLRIHATAATRAQRLREVEAHVATGRNGNPIAGRWRGAGLTSSAAATNPLTALAVGTSGDDVIAKYTYNGDANLDGRVNADDYFRIDQGFLAQPIDPLFAQGDFNYDARVNADDYFLIDQAFLGQGAPLTNSTALTAISVPEPSFTSILLACAAGATLRRRRRAEPSRHPVQ